MKSSIKLNQTGDQTCKVRMESSKKIKDLKKEIPGKFGKYKDLKTHKELNNVYLFPTLYKNTSRGNIMEWHIAVRVDKVPKNLITLYDHVPEGAVASFWSWNIEKTESGGTPMVSNLTKIKEGKNIGKANETNVFTQALLEAFSLYRSKIKEGYRLDLEVDTPNAWRKPPMRFELIGKHMKKLKFPAYIMPKFDGVFAEAVLNPELERVEIVSRQLHPFTNVKYHLEELEKVFEKYPDLLLFGEFYKPGMRLQEISGITRNESKTNKLTYYVFDCIRTSKLEAPFEERLDLLNKIFDKYLSDAKYIEHMQTEKIKDEKEMKKIYKKYLDAGYEGAMFYNKDGIYKFFYTASRSNSIFKMKPRRSEEFKIVGFKDGRGKNQGLLSLIMETEDGHKFSCEPNMPEEVRRKLFTKFQKKFDWKDKMGTVTYSDLSEKGIPMQPKFIAVRDEN